MLDQVLFFKLAGKKETQGILLNVIITARIIHAAKQRQGIYSILHLFYSFI